MKPERFDVNFNYFLRSQRSDKYQTMVNDHEMNRTLGCTSLSERDFNVFSLNHLTQPVTA